MVCAMKLSMKPSVLALLLLVSALAAGPARAVDPLYEPELEHLSQVLGSLYFINPLCRPGGKDWRVEMSELIGLDAPDDDRRQRLAGAFNAGYQNYARLYRECTPSAKAALVKLLGDAEQTARDIHAHYAQ
jgi:uncharacterized protein (TIGR02301 family)